MTPAERARSLIERSIHMTLATADESGAPWVSPLFFAPGEGHDLYWMSWVESRHSANVRARPEVAIVVYDAGPPVEAVYLTARAAELSAEDEVRRGIEAMRRRDHLQPDHWRIGDVADVTGDAPWRLYRAVRRSTEVRATKEVAGKPVVTREAVDF